MRSDKINWSKMKYCFEKMALFWIRIPIRLEITIFVFKFPIFEIQCLNFPRTLNGHLGGHTGRSSWLGQVAAGPTHQDWAESSDPTAAILFVKILSILLIINHFNLNTKNIIKQKYNDHIHPIWTNFQLDDRRKYKIS